MKDNKSNNEFLLHLQIAWMYSSCPFVDGLGAALKWLSDAVALVVGCIME